MTTAAPPPLAIHCTPPAWVMTEVCKGFSNRHKRLMVAAWALTPPLERTPIETFRRVWNFYNLQGGDRIDRPGKVTIASILNEVAGIVG